MESHEFKKRGQAIKGVKWGGACPRGVLGNAQRNSNFTVSVRKQEGLAINLWENLFESALDILMHSQ